MPSPTLSYHPSPRKPRLVLPAGACDAHVHAFGPQERFPLAADRRFTPCDAPKEKLFALHARLGIERCVVVQSNAHGFDNSVTEDALAARNGAYVGIALVPVTISEPELRRLDAAGFRGARFHFMHHLGASEPRSRTRRWLARRSARIHRAVRGTAPGAARDQSRTPLSLRSPGMKRFEDRKSTR